MKSQSLVKCETCGNPFYKLDYYIKKQKHHYCCRKCSCIRRNKLRWKNHKKPIDVFCNKCGGERDYRGRGGLCNKCNKNKITEKCKSTTVDEIIKKHKNRQYNQWYSTEIRNFNRVWNKHLLSLPCQKCGYKNHTELCHIKPISKFSIESKLSEVNNENNNVILCPNHHWEFDNGILKLEDIPKRLAEQVGVEPTLSNYALTV